MSYRQLRFTIIGASPLLMHSGRLIDPLDPHAMAIAQVAGRRRKTQADLLRLAELEFLGALYLSGGKPCIPGEMIEAALFKAAARERRGSSARAGLIIRDDAHLEYHGPTDPHALWADEAFRLRCAVRVGTSRIMRTRPVFKQWRATVTVDFMASLLNPHDVHSFLVTAGGQIGIGDWRPKFGRFWVEEPAKRDSATEA